MATQQKYTTGGSLGGGKLLKVVAPPHICNLPEVKPETHALCSGTIWECGTCKSAYRLTMHCDGGTWSEMEAVPA